MTVILEVIQVLRNAVGGGAISRKTVTKVYGSILLALREGGWVSIFQGKGVTCSLEWPPINREILQARQSED